MTKTVYSTVVLQLDLLSMRYENGSSGLLEFLLFLHIIRDRLYDDDLMMR